MYALFAIFVTLYFLLFTVTFAGILTVPLLTPETPDFAGFIAQVPSDESIVHFQFPSSLVYVTAAAIVLNEHK